MFESLARVSTAGTKLGSYISALLPQSRGGLKKYQKWAIPELPESASAGGIRPGAINECASGQVPSEYVARGSGHDMACSSAHWKYVDPNRAILVPMAIVLSGFPPLRYGELGKGSVHVKLDVGRPQR